MEKFRFIDTVKKGLDGFSLLAYNEAILQNVALGKSPPTFHLNRPAAAGVSVGYYQNVADEVDIAMCKKLGIIIGRRYYGGGAIYQENEIEYSICQAIGGHLSPVDVLTSYKLICEGVIQSLLILGINSTFKPVNDIIVGNKKISGNAQTRRNGVLFQEGTIILDVDVDKMFTVLKVPAEKVKQKHINDIKQCVTSVNQELQKKISFEELSATLRYGFATACSLFLEEDTFNDDEEKYAERARIVFSADTWTYKR